MVVGSNSGSDSGGKKNGILLFGVRHIVWRLCTVDDTDVMN